MIDRAHGEVRTAERKLAELGRRRREILGSIESLSGNLGNVVGEARSGTNGILSGLSAGAT